MIKNVVICAHFDDEVIGCSSLLNEETMIILVCSNDPRKSIFEDLMKKYNFSAMYLNYTPFSLDFNKSAFFNKKISDILEKYPNTEVYTHSNDLHIDHRIVNEAVKIATRPSRTNFKALYEFEVDNFTNFSNYFKKCEDKVQKLDFYKDFINENHKNYILSYNNFLGHQNNINSYTEGFKVVYKK